MREVEDALGTPIHPGTCIKLTINVERPETLQERVKRALNSTDTKLKNQVLKELV